MENSAARVAEKKDKMEGNVFSDLGKKPPETRGKRVYGQLSLLRTWALVSKSRCGRAIPGAQPESKEET